MDYSFYRTLWRGSWRKRLPPPPGVYLLPISSWYVAGPSRYLIVPTLPEGLRYAVDSGAYRYTRSSGHYPFDFSDYLAWCQTLDPAPIWVAIPDWSGGRTAPEPTWQRVSSHFHFLAALYSAKFQRLEITHVQQIRTALMAYAVWDHFRSAVPCWVPVLQGGKTATDYVWHARLMQPLIEEMAAYYGPESPFRVGIGGLVGKSASAVLEIVAAIAAVLPGFTFHLFGWKLRALQEMPAAFPKCIAGLSSDSSQWNGQRVRGKTPGKKAWQESGLTQLAYAYCMALPSYEARLMEAWKRLQSLPSFPVPALDEDPSLLERLRVFLRMRVFLNAQFRDSPFDLVDIRPAEEDEEDEEGLPPPDITDLSTVYEIYHAIGPQARFRQASDLWHRERKSFRLVALVRAPLDQLFERTNSIDSLWTENEEVVWCRSARLRSSSVGDVFVSCESGKAWMVAHAGFLDLSHTLDAGAVAEVSGVVLCDDLSSTSLELTEKPTKTSGAGASCGDGERRWRNTYAFKVGATTARQYCQDFLICLNGSTAIQIHAPKPKFCYAMKYRIDDRQRRPVMVRHETKKMRFILHEHIEARKASAGRHPQSPALDFPPGSLFAQVEGSAHTSPPPGVRDE